MSLLSHPFELPEFVKKTFNQLETNYGIDKETALKEYLYQFYITEPFLRKAFPTTAPEKIIEFRQKFAIGKTTDSLIQGKTPKIQPTKVHIVKTIYVDNNGKEYIFEPIVKPTTIYGDDKK